MLGAPFAELPARTQHRAELLAAQQALETCERSLVAFIRVPDCKFRGAQA